MRAVPRVGLRRLWSGSDLDYLVVLAVAGPTSEIRQILAQCGTTDIQVKMSNTLSYNNVRGVAQLGSAPALGADCATPVFHNSQVRTTDSSTNPEYDFQTFNGVRVL